MSSLEVTDREAAAMAKEPQSRVSLADIERRIANTRYVTADIAIGRPGLMPYAIMTLAFVEMRNGFIVIGKSAPAAPGNFNEELGRKFAYEDAVRQLWPILGYALRDRLDREGPA